MSLVSLGSEKRDRSIRRVKILKKTSVLFTLAAAEKKIIAQETIRQHNQAIQKI